MQFKESFLKGVVEIFPRVFADERGFFLESYNQRVFEENAIPFNFVQDNLSFSIKNTLRGLHFQHLPYAQGKLVRVVTGKVLDVVVDIRENSSTFGQCDTFILDAKNHNMVYVPEGFAHGFVALEDSIFSYKCTQFYHKASESGIIWNDPTLNIQWGIEHPLVSEKDKQLPYFKDAVRENASLQK